MKTVLWKNDIASVIEQRLGLQSTQKQLEEEFDIYLPGLHSLKGITAALDEMEPSQRNKFILLVGGKTNFEKTKKFLESL